MQKLIIAILAAAVVTLSACTTVNDKREPATHTTSTTETQTIR
jgi:uncharacterized lipoprotein